MPSTISRNLELMLHQLLLMIEVTQNKIRMDTVTMTRMMKLLILLTWMILMTKMMTWRKYDTALSSAAAAGAELNGHLLT